MDAQFFLIRRWHRHRFKSGISQSTTKSHICHLIYFFTCQCCCSPQGTGGCLLHPAQGRAGTNLEGVEHPHPHQAVWAIQWQGKQPILVVTSLQLMANSWFASHLKYFLESTTPAQCRFGSRSSSFLSHFHFSTR